MKIIYFVVLGAVISFVLNYLADVLPATRRLSRPHCRNCGHPFTVYEYLISFRCPQCKTRPGARYWMVLVLSIVITVALAFFPMKPLNFWLSLPLIAFLGLIMIIDIEHRAVLLETDVVGLVFGIVYGLILHKPLEALLGGLIAAGVMLALFYGGVLFNRMVGRIRKQEVEEVAFGLGDVIVSGYLGLIVGLKSVAGFLLLSVIFGGVFALFYLLVKLLSRKYSAFSAIPYVPFMILAMVFLFYSPF